MIEMHLQEALFYLNALSKQACVVLSAYLHVVITPSMDNAINIDMILGYFPLILLTYKYIVITQQVISHIFEAM